MVNQFPLVVFHHLVQATRDILGPEATIVYEVVSKEMGADSTVAAHMVLQDVGAYGLVRVRVRGRVRVSLANPNPNPNPNVLHYLYIYPSGVSIDLQAASSTCATQSSPTRGAATPKASAASSMWTTYCLPLTRQRPWL